MTSFRSISLALTGLPQTARQTWSKCATICGVTNSGKKPTRLKIKPTVMRELLLASGGRCAMDRCGDPLISATRGWIGTVAHIIGAEEDGPRGKSDLTPEQRRNYDNLILMCANHGREVDAPDTGEANFPVAMLRQLKEAHEQKISEAVTQAIDLELQGFVTASGLFDTAPRDATVAITGAGLADALEDDSAETTESLVEALADCRARLRRLSQSSIDALSQLLDLWTLTQCSEGDFGDWSGIRVRLPMGVVHNRAAVARQEQWRLIQQELVTQSLLEVDEDDGEYILQSPWDFALAGHSYDFWRLSAEFLQCAHGLKIGGWLRGLDFSIFDEVASPAREVTWR